jgi:hypothetical protein
MPRRPRRREEARGDESIEALGGAIAQDAADAIRRGDEVRARIRETMRELRKTLEDAERVATVIRARKMSR